MQGIPKIQLTPELADIDAHPGALAEVLALGLVLVPRDFRGGGLVVVLRPREFRWLTIRLTGQNNCGTIGLSSLQKTPTDRGRGRRRGSKLQSLWLTDRSLHLEVD